MLIIRKTSHVGLNKMHVTYVGIEATLVSLARQVRNVGGLISHRLNGEVHAQDTGSSAWIGGHVALRPHRATASC